MKTFSSPLDATRLTGRKVRGYSPGLYQAALLLDGGEAIGFYAQEHDASHWFEVFTLLAEPEAIPRDWILFPEPRLVESCALLWRNEWMEEGASQPTLGADPKTQHAGRGPVPASAIAAARVQAGLLLRCSNAADIVAATSASSPFGIDLAVDANEVSKLLADFEQSQGPAAQRDPSITVRAIAADEWPQYRKTRLQALEESPDAFGGTWEKEVQWADEAWARRIAAAACGTTDTGLFAIQGERIVGLVWCKLSDASCGVAGIYQMWVDPAARGLGAGHCLLTQALAWAQSRGASRVRLGVTVADSAAVRLYLAHGFFAAGQPERLREGSDLMVQAMELALGSVTAR